ncbi:hypothetical protein [Xanthomonas euvesicatoria]|uniref:hypothetical protein n=1 Tax=Xanthomonas euvesicatoria TaxID=456327 RepID=UPI001C4677B3|nr:hypothetical protein [Xanthomonas euvesicatoria]MBV6885963.1 hypothetical protein [Xanthomonas campestris pv. euphorbiae]
MTKKLGPAIEEINGFTVREIFVLGEDGEYISIGYGVFNPEGKIIAAFPDYESALDYLQKIAGPKPRHPQP